MIQRTKPSVYFSPGFNPPASNQCPLVFVIHDLIHLRVAAEASQLKRLYYEKVVRPAVRRAARILTVSAFSKRDLVEWSGVHEEQVVVVSNGVSEAFQVKGPVRTTDCPYFLFVGARKPHKNLSGVLEGFARSGLAKHSRLLLTGHADRHVVRLASELKIASCLDFIGNVPDSELACFYRGAVALVAPSLYEGFCLPALEAMACGCPVIAARADAQYEVIGDEGLFVDPLRVDEIADAMLKLFDSERRQALIAHGLRRSGLYSWDETAGKVRLALEEAQQDRQRSYVEVLA